MVKIIFLLLGGFCAFLAATPLEIAPVGYTFDQGTDTGSYTYHDETGRQLIDGFYGTAPWSANLGNGPAYEWLGWSGNPIVNIDFDFGSQTTIHQIRIGTTQDNLVDVVIPSIYIYTSSNLSTWTLIDSRIIAESSSYDNVYLPISFTNLNLSSRYIRVSVRHSLDGPWSFVDEVDFYQDQGLMAQAEVPEPASFVLFGLAMMGLTLARKRIF